MSSTPDHPAEEASARATAFRGWSRALPSVRVALELARVELHQGVRRLAAQDYWVLYGLVSAFGLLLGSWRAFVLGRNTGTALATGTSTWFLSGGAGTLWILWVFVTGVVVVHAVGSNGDVAHDGHYLTIRPTADVAAGKLLAAACSFAVFVFVPVLACFLGLAVGYATPIPLLGGVVAAAVTVATATAVGVPVGFVLKGLVRRSALLTRLKPVLAVAVGVAYVVVVMTGEVTAVVSGLQPVLRSPPLGWLADLSLATTTDANASPVGAVGALVGGVITVATGTLVAVPAARYAWHADRMHPADDTDDATPPTHRIDALLATVTRAPATRAAASTTLLRVYRSPLQLVFAAAPLVFAIPMADALLATRSLPWYAPWLAVWYGAWAAGAAVPLNPLGNLGATLPALLTAPADGRRVVHGNVLAAVFPAAPPTAAAAVALGALASRPTPALAGVAVVAVAVVVASSVVAAGIGCVFPRFDAMDIAGSRRAVPPSKVAYGVFSTTLTVAVGAIAVLHDDFARRVVAVLASRRLPVDLTGNSTALTPVAWGVLAVVVLAVPVAYRVAVRRVDCYHVS